MKQEDLSFQHNQGLKNGVTKKIIERLSRKNYYLDCRSAQKMPLFLPIVCSSEFIVRQFPCAVQSTKIQTKSLSGE